MLSFFRSVVGEMFVRISLLDAKRKGALGSPIQSGYSSISSLSYFVLNVIPNTRPIRLW
ncbi:hypothetical protein D3C71_1036460 [compost metagenome]